MAASSRITMDAEICHGKPVIAGTRIPVSVIVGSLAGGMSFDDVVREYGVSPEDIRAALAYVTELVERERHYPLAG